MYELHIIYRGLLIFLMFCRYVRAEAPNDKSFKVTWHFEKGSRNGILTEFLIQYRVSENNNNDNANNRHGVEEPKARLAAVVKPSSPSLSSGGNSDEDGDVNDPDAAQSAWLERKKPCIHPDGINYCNSEPFFQ